MLKRLIELSKYLLLFYVAAGAFTHAYCSVETPGSKIDPEILHLTGTGREGGVVKVWIFLEDISSNRGSSQKIKVRERALRRMRLRSSIQESEYPLNPPSEDHLKIIRPLVKEIRYRSIYLNAVCAEVEIEDLIAVSDLPFVRRIQPQVVFRKKQITEYGSEHGSKEEEQDYRGDPLYGKYGESLGQLDMIEAAQLLENGYNGSGEKNGRAPVVIAVLDTGFDLDHEAFDEINVLLERDFVQDDSVTANQDGDSELQDRHGTAVLGALAGYREGKLIGPGWGAEFLLAKTEIVDDEILLEEEMWIKGIEWADTMGADIVTSSLGYTEWYSPEDFDGESALCTIVAGKAASRGVLLVNAMGNYGYLGGTSLIAPADADSIISVGSVDATGSIAWNSSRGPTADGRIKPEITAQGVGVYTVEPSSVYQYSRFSGTSMATPLIAGLCAQLLDVNPQLDPMEVREAIISTGTRSANPDNIYGFGIAKGLSAAGVEEPEYTDSKIFSRLGPNPFRNEIEFTLFFSEWQNVSIAVYDCRGALIRRLAEDRVLKYEWKVTWNGRDDNGKRVPAGVYFISVAYGKERATRKLVFMP